MSEQARQTGPSRPIVEEVYPGTGASSSVVTARLPSFTAKPSSTDWIQNRLRAEAEAATAPTLEMRVASLEERLAALEERLDGQSERKRWR